MALAVSLFSLQSCEDVPAPYDIPGIGGGNGGDESNVEPKGTGTLEDPYNVAAVVAYCKSLDADVESPNVVYIKGKVKNNTTTDETISSYGNMTFTMVDEGGSLEFTAFQVYGPGNKKFTSVDQIKQGDEVVVCGKVVNYKGNTPETVGKGAAYVYSINGEGGTSVPTEVIEISCAKAVELCNALGDGETSTEVYSITGYITDVFATVSKGQQSFWMADTKDGGKVLQAYWANLPEGVAAFKKGSKVKIVGSLLKYVKDGNVTTEVKNADVVILEEGSDSDEPVTGDATEVSCAKAVEICNALEDKTETKENYTVTGYITETDGKISRDQQVFWMADTKDGGKVFEAYWANIPDPTKALPVGTKVKMTGKLMRYGSTPEMKNGTVVVLEMGEGGGSSEGGGTAVEPTGDNYIANGDFEAWDGNTPVNWKSASTASSASLSQSKDAHGGSYSCVVKGDANSNKRLAYKEITLDAGTYTFSFYAKGTADPSQVRPGFVPVTDGKVGSYAYGDYATISNQWTAVSHTFTLDKTTTICLVIMNPKKSAYSAGADVLIDDATLTKSSAAKKYARRK